MSRDTSVAQRLYRKLLTNVGDKAAVACNNNQSLQ